MLCGKLCICSLKAGVVKCVIYRGEVDRILVSVPAPNVDKWALSADIGFGRKQLYHIWCTFGFGVLQLVNSVVAKSRYRA